MRRSVEESLPVLERVEEEIALSAASGPERGFHIDPARLVLAELLRDLPPSVAKLSDSEATLIESAARHLEGIQLPAELRRKALGWARDLRALLSIESTA